MPRAFSKPTGTRTSGPFRSRRSISEFGFAIPVGAEKVVPRVDALVEDAESDLPDALRPSLAAATREIGDFERRIKEIEHELRQLARQNPVVTRLMTVPGFGLITATAFVAFIGDVGRVPSGRHLASYLGITPRERSSGLVRRLGMISKRGDSYLRMLLTHGARAVLHAAKAKKHPDRLRAWALDLERRRGHNRATIALANKLARIAWAVWHHDRNFETQTAAL
jgi:transposase